MEENQQAALAELCRHLKRAFPHRQEIDVQNALARILASADYTFRREHSFNRRDRIDFLVDIVGRGKIGVEVKTAGSAAQADRQLLRYALTGEVDALVLITTKPFNLAAVYSHQGRSIPLHNICIAKNALGQS